jgi:deoxyribose-phosphate aldolase
MLIAHLIDHTALKPTTDIHQIDKLCLEAEKYGFATVCVNPTWVKYCAGILTGTKVKVCTVIGFPFGANIPEVKAYEAIRAFAEGAKEIDMVINIGALKSRFIKVIERDIAAVRMAVPEAILKVIIETCLLNEDEKITACLVSRDAGADFVKTSTGFSFKNATLEDVRLMHKLVGDTMGVKASGGIKDYKTAKAMIDAGATRLGCSASVSIVTAGL